MTRRRLTPLITLATAVSLLVPAASAAAAAPAAPAAPAVQPVEHVITNTITWRLSDGAGGYAAYRTMLNQLRAAATQDRIGNHPSLPMTYSANNDGVIALNISGGNARLTLYFTRSNLYLRGFGVTNSNQVFQFGDSDYDLNQQIDATAITNLNFSGDYVGDRSLQNTARTNRAGLQYGIGQFTTDIAELSRYAPGGDNAQAATSLLRLIGATSEAARQTPLADTIATAIRNRTQSTLTGSELSYENMWNALSTYFSALVAGQHPAPVTFNNGQQIITVNGANMVAAVFALLLRPGAGGTHG
ncbi:ribosome-inactivating family protein [Kitasatospora sp. NPDC094028]